MTKNEQIASIMLEAAELLKLDESAGQNGMNRKLANSIIANERKEYNKAKKKYEEYERAGYEDTPKGKEYKYDVDYYEGRIAKANRLNNAYKAAKKSGMPLKSSRIIAQESKDDNIAYSEMSNNLSDKSKKLHERINKRAKLNEAIDFLYERAVLCEEAEDALAYIEKAEELQKAIEDIPEEKPVQQDKYNTSVVGGDDQDPELEEIKDLCDNDPDVMKLLTDDEDKSVTVD